MKLHTRISMLFFIGIFAVGSTALGYYYYYVYNPPLKAAELFMAAMESGTDDTLRQAVIVSVGPNNGVETGELREPDDKEIKRLQSEHFQRGRILDQRKREGRTRNFDYLVYREPDGRIFALVVTAVNGRFRVVIPES